MKSIVLFLFVLAASLRAVEPTVTGEWSAPVKGLRGRLLFAEDAPFNGTRMGVIYLELQNVSGVLNPLLIDFHPPRLHLVDSAGEPIPDSPAAESVFTPGPYTLVMPLDSTLRFRISVSGYGISKNGGLAIQLDSAFWMIPADVQGERFLAGPFAVPELNPIDIEAERKDRARGNPVWRGLLNLPRLKIPASAPK